MFTCSNTKYLFLNTDTNNSSIYSRTCVSTAGMFQRCTTTCTTTQPRQLKLCRGHITNRMTHTLVL